MANSAVEGSSLPETAVCGIKDERMQIKPMTSPPYKWICSLLIESATGGKSVGSGFKIHLSDVNRTAIVTSGHCTYVEGAYAVKIIVEFAGQRAIEVRRNDLYASPEYINSGSADHDYGLILLPGRGASDDGFGWSAIVKNEELDHRFVTNCGFPADKPRGTMWITGGHISIYTANRFFYMNDSMSVKSGSPVFTWYGGYWTVLGVQGRCYPNSAPRFTLEMISRFLVRMNGLKIKLIRSVPFPDVYVRCYGGEVTKPKNAGGGNVNCQYKPPNSWEHFHIYPVEMTPSLAVEKICKVVIESAHFRNVFIRMDSKGMSQFESPGGGGEVNCQAYPGPYEMFFFKEEEDGSYSFRSVQFPHCYIRLDGRRVTAWSGGGGGTVNCQWYDFSTPPGSWERFHVEER